MDREIIVKEWRDDKGLIHRREIGQELVRCKDCIFAEADTEAEMYLCRSNGSDWNNGEHFCSDGERKDKPQDDSKKYMMSDFSKYCPSCKHKYFDKWTEPCATCLLMKGQINTDIPVGYEEKPQTERSE